MSFKDDEFEQRWGTMGDLAEGAYETWAGQHAISYVRYGLDRTPFNPDGKLIRYTPDFLEAHRLVEVQGFGADATVKLKLDKLRSLLWWNEAMPVWLWLWDSEKHLHGQLPIGYLPLAAATLGSFPEGKLYHEWTLDSLGLDWQDVDGS